MALQIAMMRNIPVEIVDPHPVEIDYPNLTCHAMTAGQYIALAEA
jgi:hypothetical protein